jgi:uncharacterized protein (TIGR03437 family)
MLLLSMAGWAQPVIAGGNNAIVNASSYAAGIAQGSWFVVFGTGMGPATLAVSSGLPYQAQLAGTSVSFTPTSGGASVSALLWYTSAGQLAGMLPSSTPTGSYNVTVTYNGATSNPHQVNVVARNFGFATQAQNGNGPAQATYGGLDLNRFTTGTLGQYTFRPAQAGDTMVLWGTGLGADPNSDITGGTSGDMTAAAQVQVMVGGIAVTPLYAGRSNGSPGLDQINFVIPASAMPGCFVNLSVQAGGKTSNLGTIAVATAGQTACPVTALTAAQLAKLDQGGSLVLGRMGLFKSADQLTYEGKNYPENIEHASGFFSTYTIGTIGSSDFAFGQVGSCFVTTGSGTENQLTEGIPPAPLDAGTQLTLNGPNAANVAIPAVSTGDYSATLYDSGLPSTIAPSGSPTLVQGTYTISGAGGADVGPFSVSINFPSNLNWVNVSKIPSTVLRSNGLPITWSGVSSGVVTVTGLSAVRTGGSVTNGIYSGTIFTCSAPASAGSFTVPASVLEQLPPASNDLSSASFGGIIVSATSDATSGQGQFSAPLTKGGTVDQGYLYYSSGSSITVGWN